jgi:hypothetical protein
VPRAASPEQRQAVLAQLVKEQHAGGFWQNSCPLMREDDPLIATSFAVVALAILGEDKSSGAANSAGIE